jgi:hypothetical protein
MGRNFFIEHALDKVLTEHVAGCVWQTYNRNVHNSTEKNWDMA